jgi:folylpolyglutamate synthase/dihydropteroate synthase
MLKKIFEIPKSKIYLTETPFKGIALKDYPEEFLRRSFFANANIEDVFECIRQSTSNYQSDGIIVTGSLYLVGQVLKTHGVKI